MLKKLILSAFLCVAALSVGAQTVFRPVENGQQSYTATSVSGGITLLNTSRQIVFYNAGTVDVFIRWSSTSLPVVTVPVPGGAAGGYAIGAGMKETLSLPNNPTPMFIAAITASGSAVIYVAPGDGV